jgi:hypothetical protein
MQIAPWFTNAVAAHFPGGQMIFDICNSFIVKRAGSNVGGTGATYKWGLDDPQDIRTLSSLSQSLN